MATAKLKLDATGKNTYERNLKAIFTVRLEGRPLADIAAEFNMSAGDLQELVNNYRRPDKDVIDDLLTEACIARLRGKVAGTELSGIVNALKTVGNDSSSNLQDFLIELATAANPQLELTQEEV